MRANTVAIAASGLVAATASHVGGALPAMVQAPSAAGFRNPVVHPSRGGRAVCVSGYMSVPAMTNKQIKLDFEVPKNQTGATETFLEYVTPGSGFLSEIMDGTTSVNGTYDIYSTLCTPADNTAPQGVQLLTHGVGFDGSYWDFAPGYSYVDVAVDAGYAAFFYDRLSVGKSQIVDAVNVAQAPLEVAIAHTLATKLRSGAISNHSFSTVVAVGHSFGSLVTQSLTANYPSALDAAILTGFSVNMSAINTFITGLNLALAKQNEPLRFGDLPPGYLVSDTAISNQIGFFKAPGFDPAILSLSEATKGTVTYGELFTQGVVAAPAMNWTSPLAVVNGIADLPFCYGNCTVPMDLAAAVQPALYPMLNGSRFGSYLAPVAGHGLNLHYSATEAYQYIQQFLVEQGLGM